MSECPKDDFACTHSISGIIKARESAFAYIKVCRHLQRIILTV